MRPRRPDWDRFYAKTAWRGSHLIWLAGPQFRMYDGYRREPHRCAWVIARGPVPDGMAVIRGCGNSRCVLVDHLQLRKEKDVGPMAARAARKLTARQVRQIRAMPIGSIYRGGRPRGILPELARKFGVAVRTIELVRYDMRRYAEVKP